MASAKVRPLPHLDPGEVALVDFAADDPRDTVTLSDKEALILQLYNRVQEQALEKALLEQDTQLLSGEDADEQLATAERELLESRATYTAKRKAINTVLMTDPTLRAVHLKATSPAEQALLRLINRRDLLSLAHENLNAAHNAALKRLSDLEVENIHLHRINKDLVRQLLDLSQDDDSWKEELEDADLKTQLEQVRTDYKKTKAKWETVKNVASAIVVGSGVDWTKDEALVSLVLDESDD
ncbi:hypothetical protein FE257_008037 [Aspergillus nanangensis]|uniref:Centromere protein H C-terminal domain-containing protein n=1 Tax=Aspergillus nanangensis TaxID=2582783 RepID=A0AAD4GTX0_ASPNN|nr:hypothetical protein FE257_008037 [Aspergillus nanangensis]